MIFAAIIKGIIGRIQNAHHLRTGNRIVNILDFERIGFVFREHWIYLQK